MSPANGKRPIVDVTRSESISASHRLHSKLLGDEENSRIFGKCNNPNGHGHNYKVDVTVRGPVDEVTGMVINVSDLKVMIQKVVMNVFDHKNVDLDVPVFRDTNLVSTAENIAVVIYDGIAELLPEGVKLHRVRLHETGKNVVDYYGIRE